MTTPPTVPGPDPLDGAALLDTVEALFRKFTVQPTEHAYVALTVYVAYTHAAHVFDFAPRLVLTSAEKRSGKTRTMEIARGLSHRPLPTANATPAAIFRSLGDGDTRTLCFDEADTIFGTKIKAEQNEDLRGLLNAGFQKGTPVLRTVGPTHDVAEFETFSPAIIAAIGKLPDTITDRAVNIRLRRRKHSEKVSQYRIRKDQPTLERVGAELGQWVELIVDDLAVAEPHTPLEDRAADVWEPLLSVADLAGGQWPRRTRIAAIALTNDAADADSEQSEGLELLSDIREVLTLVSGQFVGTTTLLELLKSKAESRWTAADLSARHLSDLLKPYQIRPKPSPSGNSRGYRVPEFTDAFDRYLPQVRQEASEPSDAVSDQGKQSDTSGVSDTSNRQMGDSTDSDASLSSDTSMCQTPSNRQDVSPGQDTYLTHLTGSDDPWPEEEDTERRYVWGENPNILAEDQPDLVEDEGPDTGDITLPAPVYDPPRGGRHLQCWTYLQQHGTGAPNEIAAAIGEGFTKRAAAARLGELVKSGHIRKIATGEFASHGWWEQERLAS